MFGRCFWNPEGSPPKPKPGEGGLPWWQVYTSKPLYIIHNYTNVLYLCVLIFICTYIHTYIRTYVWVGAPEHMSKQGSGSHLVCVSRPMLIQWLKVGLWIGRICARTDCRIFGVMDPKWFKLGVVLLCFGALVQLIVWTATVKVATKTQFAKPSRAWDLLLRSPLTEPSGRTQADKPWSTP